MEKIDYYGELSAERKVTIVQKKKPLIRFGKVVEDGSAPICPINGKQMTPWLKLAHRDKHFAPLQKVTS